ncbi:hypothetical protein T4E_8152 [Trichinella pseudospiralis]|uniref:Uncharacterized protein n=1 Tax=Trichinella pseudospiralis TaxID=6337 RepID=A0A0V0XER4_TRIPS|nr:hypothetical protein T4E_3312 [Trichinella pseudospiralis]KRX86408.1 hypothetical protein T4E_7809 [Trichinella pseudospiralis]KRX86631.1 hypothetical protein T4E_298 [Trichinella pseudospiralis]KRX87738.1 hypothetical protein T4E_5884 [Trichinella pseudospiralis]KRX87739.1 hypothetical protein T4E_8152 [Trichinella pseudospiralis]
MEVEAKDQQNNHIQCCGNRAVKTDAKHEGDDKSRHEKTCAFMQGGKKPGMITILKTSRHGEKLI